jgi:replicative DNA helicase
LSVDPEALVLGGIIPDRPDRIARTRIRLTPEHFFSENHRSIYGVLQRMYDRYGTIMEPDVFNDFLARRHDAGSAKLVVLEQLY